MPCKGLGYSDKNVVIPALKEWFVHWKRRTSTKMVRMKGDQCSDRSLRNRLGAGCSDFGIQRPVLKMRQPVKSGGLTGQKMVRMQNLGSGRRDRKRKR